MSQSKPVVAFDPSKIGSPEWWAIPMQASKEPAVVRAAGWDPNLHPRGHGGEWARNNGGSTSSRTTPESRRQAHEVNSSGHAGSRHASGEAPPEGHRWVRHTDGSVRVEPNSRGHAVLNRPGGPSGGPSGNAPTQRPGFRLPPGGTNAGVDPSTRPAPTPPAAPSTTPHPSGNAVHPTQASWRQAQRINSQSESDRQRVRQRTPIAPEGYRWNDQHQLERTDGQPDPTNAPPSAPPTPTPPTPPTPSRPRGVPQTDPSWYQHLSPGGKAAADVVRGFIRARSTGGSGVRGAIRAIVPAVRFRGAHPSVVVRGRVRTPPVSQPTPARQRRSPVPPGGWLATTAAAPPDIDSVMTPAPDAFQIQVPLDVDADALADLKGQSWSEEDNIHGSMAEVKPESDAACTLLLTVPAGTPAVYDDQTGTVVLPKELTVSITDVKGTQAQGTVQAAMTAAGQPPDQPCAACGDLGSSHASTDLGEHTGPCAECNCQKMVTKEQKQKEDAARHGPPAPGQQPPGAPTGSPKGGAVPPTSSPAAPQIGKMDTRRTAGFVMDDSMPIEPPPPSPPPAPDATSKPSTGNDDPHLLIQGVDAVVDAALDRLTGIDTSTLPPAVQAALDLLTAADATLDSLMEVMQIPDVDASAEAAPVEQPTSANIDASDVVGLVKQLAAARIDRRVFAAPSLLAEQRMVEALAENRGHDNGNHAGNAQRLRDWFNKGADGQIPWGVPGDFAACVRLAKKHMTKEQANGYCNNRHQDVTGEAAGKSAHGGGHNQNQHAASRAEFADTSASGRKSAAKAGTAMADGSFPISNADDLGKAIKLAGNAKNPEAAKRHIRRRARKLKMESRLPDSWQVRRTEQFGTLEQNATGHGPVGQTGNSFLDIPGGNPPPAKGKGASSSSSSSKHPHAAAGSPNGGQFITTGSGSGAGSNQQTQNEVKGAQKALGLPQTGVFSASDTAALKQYQAAHGLQADGVLGAQTAASLQGKQAKVGALTGSDHSFLGGGSTPKAAARTKATAVAKVKSTANAAAAAKTKAAAAQAKATKQQAAVQKAAAARAASAAKTAATKAAATAARNARVQARSVRVPSTKPIARPAQPVKVAQPIATKAPGIVQGPAVAVTASNGAN